MNGRYEPAKRARQTEPAMNSPSVDALESRCGWSWKSCGSWSITVDDSTVVNIAVTQTDEARETSSAHSIHYTPW